MHPIGNCNISLRSSARKRVGDSWNNRNEEEFRRKHKSCSGKVHALGIQKIKRKSSESLLKNKFGDKCALKRYKSLGGVTIAVDQKVPSSSQEATNDDDTINCTESDNEKLKCNPDNCLGTTNSANEIKSDLKKWEPASQWGRSRSCNRVDSLMQRKCKVLKIRGPFGALVDLSDPFDRTPFSRGSKSLHSSHELDESLAALSTDTASDAKPNDETKVTDNQNYENLLNAINNLKKRADAMDVKATFESLQVREFETTEVSRLFEKYYGAPHQKDGTGDTISIIEELITGLRKAVDSTLPKGKIFQETKYFKLSDSNEDKSKLRKKKGNSEKSKLVSRNEILERKWKPGGVVKQSAPSSFTVERTKIGLGKRRNDELPRETNERNRLGERTVSITLSISGKSKNKKSTQSESKSNREKEGGSGEQGTSDPGAKVSDRVRGKPRTYNDAVVESKIPIQGKPRKNVRTTGKSLKSFSNTEKFQIKSEMEDSIGTGTSAAGKVKAHKNQTLREKLDSSIKEYLTRTGGIKLEIVEDSDEANLENGVKVGENMSKMETALVGSHISSEYERIYDTRYLNIILTDDKPEVNVEKLDVRELPKTLSRGRGSVRKLISTFELNCGKEDKTKELELGECNPLSCDPPTFPDAWRKAKSDEELENERASLENEKLWLVHKAGFSAVRLLKSDASKQGSDIGKVKVKLENLEQVLEVDEDDLEKANPSQLDKIEDLSQLRYINESSILHLLRQRYGNNLIHTYSAGNLIVINPQCTLSIYNEKVAALFRGCKSEDMPPHIYSLAQTAYRSLLSTRKDQSIVLLGRSGSGKTHNFRHILSYLLHCSGSLNKFLTVERLNAVNTVLEAFGNARTCMNTSATRCTNLVNLDFDQTGQIASLSLQMLMLEKQRIVRRAEGEANFNIFYWLLAGADGSLAKQLLLDSSPPNSNLFVNSLHKSEDRQMAVMELSKLSLAFKVLGVSEKECFVIWSIICVIYHLGHAGAVQVGTNKWQFADPVHASKACRLLGTTSEELSQAIWDSPVSPTKPGTPNDKDKEVNGMESLEGFVVGLYSEVVNVVNGLINRCLTKNFHSTMSILIVDSPGFQNPASCAQHREATFSDLCHNYVQERLHLMFHNVNLVAPRDRYTQENVDLNMDEMYTEINSPNQLISILDKSPPSGVLKTSQTDLREADRRGLLWLLEEESIYPNSNDETFLERLFQHYSSKDHQMYIRKASNVGHFVIQHFQGTNPVTYCARGWLKASRENPMNRAAINFLQESAKEEISELFVTGKGLHLSVSDGSQSLRRVSSIRRTCSSAVKRKSISLQIKFTTDGLIETLRRTRPRFVFCMLAQHNAGLWDLTPGAALSENIINVPLLRSQVRGAEILPATRIYKLGFPEFVPHGEFKRRFRLLAPISGELVERPVLNIITITVNGRQAATSEAIDEAREVEEMLMAMDVDVMSYRIGLTQVFFRAGILAQLESQRDEKLADVIIQFQSRCRGYLARKKLAKLKVQDLAVRCIQKNVRKLMQVREWPWWRLYVKVTPLLNVHRTEEELSARLQELDALKSKLEKLESERNHLKVENDRLETKLSEMNADLSEERATGSLQAERLEAETAERVRLEQELSQIQQEKKNLLQTSEKLEMELFYARADVNGLSEGEGDAEDGGGDTVMYKQKCERAMRELEFTRRRLQQQHEDDLEQLVALKKQLEKKLADAYEEVEEQRQVAGQWKRKVQKFHSEMNDVRLLLEEQSSRNNLLEKKQRKFDSEIQLLQDELRSEKNQKDRLSREKEMAYAEKYAMEQNLSSVRLELELKEEKLSALTREVDELTRGGGSEQEVTQLRKTKHDLELKLKEQEEELDELAGQVSMLESTKLRLEMSLESLRKEHRREMTQREDELDEVRSNSQKKLKALEAQLENEHEERTLLLREKHELERRLNDAEERGRHHRAADEDALLRLRRDLKKTKALLRDAQMMLERTKQDSPSKAALRALKNQLDDAEVARASAVKAKQSLESELSEVNGQLEEATRAKGDAENRYQAAQRECNALRAQVDENEEELAELLKKYRQTVQQLSAEQLANQETAGALAEAEAERAALRDQLAELTAKVEANALLSPVSGMAQKRLEIRVKELESRLELEQTTRSRLEVQITRLKENVERLTEECIQARNKEQAANEATRKLQRSLREAKEELAQHQAKEQEAVHKRKELEKRLETAEQEASTARTDLRLAVKRIEDLQIAMSGEIGSDSDGSETEADEDSTDESLMLHLQSSLTSSRGSKTPDLSPR